MLYIYGANAHRFRDAVNFVALAKQKRLQFPAAEERKYMVPIAGDRTSVGHIADPQTRANARARGTISRHTAAVLGGFDADLAFHHDRIVSLEWTTGVSTCVTVPHGGRFLQNGFDGFNCQGSEWDYAVVIATKSHSFMLNRNLLYTAVTRGSKGVCVIGDKRGIRQAVAQVDTRRRRTLLSAAQPTSFVPMPLTPLDAIPAPAPVDAVEPVYEVQHAEPAYVEAPPHVDVVPEEELPF
jgi:hypothetical protein